jgi:hypothetical protein
MIFVWTLIWIGVAVAVWLVWWTTISYFVSNSKRQSMFVEGSAPTVPPDGFYKGAAYLLGGGPVPWLGKSFLSSQNLGYNIFTPTGASLLKIFTPFYQRFTTNDDGTTNAYYFRTSVGSGLKDAKTSVFKLDYDSPENPFLIRIILDEMVEVSPGEFLGKVHMKVFPGYYATIGFFGLRK